jgi:septation ring formation regulator EzrA
MEPYYDFNRLEKENQALKEEISKLQKSIEIFEKEKNKSYFELIDEKVDSWYEKFRDDIDIGKITAFEALGQKFEIDLLPDAMEKAIYKKCMKIACAIMLEMKDHI